MSVKKLGIWSLLLASALLVLDALAVVPTAEAGSVKASVYLTQAKIPGGLSEAGLIGFARGHSSKILQENTDADVKKRKWLANMVVSFNHPIDDMEFTVLFYDIEDGSRRFIEDMSTMVSNRKEKTFVQKITLPRPAFKPNRHIELVVTVKRAEVGSLK
ncbi:MAG TPA: hypothetical protein VHM19_13690, partial [Polyangiales bacterium]|nr:hypothetical protein [Polyangiales bacterium]